MWWPGTESNRRRQPFQGGLPTGLSGWKIGQVDAEKPLGRSHLWDDLGQIRPFSDPRCSHIVPRSFLQYPLVDSARGTRPKEGVSQECWKRLRDAKEEANSLLPCCIGIRT